MFSSMKKFLPDYGSSSSSSSSSSSTSLSQDSTVDDLVPLLKYSDFLDSNPDVAKMYYAWKAQTQNGFANSKSVAKKTYDHNSASKRAYQYQKTEAMSIKMFIESDANISNRFRAWDSGSQVQQPVQPQPPIQQQQQFGGRKQPAALPGKKNKKKTLSTTRLSESKKSKTKLRRSARNEFNEILSLLSFPKPSKKPASSKKKKITTSPLRKKKNHTKK